jgi:hypothetical protein
LDRALQWLDAKQRAAWREIAGPPFLGALSFTEVAADSRPASSDSRPGAVAAPR